MATMQNSINSSQMSTPISSLPLKTNQQESDIEDPLIQTVLKDFEDNIAPQQTIPVIEELPQQPLPNIYQDPPEKPINNFNELNYNNVGNEKKKLLNLEILKKAAIISIISFFVFYQNIFGILLSKFPDSVTEYIKGNEFLIHMIISFTIFYILLFYGFI